ncbi:MAG: hypothetical protein A2Z71_11725 [Chloroflexi bacterium RBG_13_50_21]|nr:MAG: hypothetical protein A2Z71_11725 [Chloroflexi bacterium RBG_13_50_21]
MAFTWTKVLSDCLLALGDPLAATWSRTATIWPWVQEAVLTIPILRPMIDDHTNAASTIIYSYQAPVDFREVITVEYPIGVQPPTYLSRKNRLDESFWNSNDFYDIDHDYTAGTGWFIWVSGGIAASAHIKMQYLANHSTTIVDDSTATWTVPDVYENIVISYVIAKAYRERLSAYMITPTAHTSTILQLTDMVKKAEDHYLGLSQRALQRLTDSRITPNVAADKFDRVY